LLAEKWLGKPCPNLFDEKMTPSHRKVDPTLLSCLLSLTSFNSI